VLDGKGQNRGRGRPVRGRTIPEGVRGKARSPTRLHGGGPGHQATCLVCPVLTAPPGLAAQPVPGRPGRGRTCLPARRTAGQRQRRRTRTRDHLASLRKAFTRHGLGMPARNREAVRQRAMAAARQRGGWPATPGLDPVFVALNPGALPARARPDAELYQWVRREEQYATLGANVVVELYSESHARRPTTRAWAIIRRADRSHRLAGQRASRADRRHADRADRTSRSHQPQEREIVAEPADPTHPDQPGQRAAVPRLSSTLMSLVHGPGAYGVTSACSSDNRLPHAPPADSGTGPDPTGRRLNDLERAGGRFGDARYRRMLVSLEVEADLNRREQRVQIKSLATAWRCGWLSGGGHPQGGTSRCRRARSAHQGMAGQPARGWRSRHRPRRR
jgi:hypothetical protein